MATPISSAHPPFVPVQLDPSKDSGKNIEGSSANPEETMGADQMEQKVEEAAAKKSKARARDSEAKGKWWPCTTTKIELRNLKVEGFLKPSSWRTIPGSLTPAPEAGEMVVTKALVEPDFSFPPTDFFSKILKAYGLQPHNISPNSILAISNHVTLCEGHLRVIPELSLFQYFFSVNKEKVPQTSSLATCGTITFKLRPGRVYPPTDRHESARYWSGGFFYLKDVSDPASTKVLPAFKDGPASETPAWTQCPHLSESPQLTRAVTRIYKLTEDGLTGKDLTLSWFTRRIQPMQHRDRQMFQYTGRDDLMRASKDNLSADAVDKRIRLLIKIPRDLRIHVCNMDIHTNNSGIALEELEEKDLGTLLRVPHSGTNDPEAASDAEVPETSGPAKRKRAAPSGPAPKRARETACAAATRRAEKEKQRLKQIDTSKQSQPNIDQFFMTSSKTSGSKLPKNPKKKAKPSPASIPVTPKVENTRKLNEDLRTHVLEQKTEIEMLQKRDAENQKSIATLETRLKNYEEQLAKKPSVDELSAELEVLKAEHDSLQEFLKKSSEKETKERKEREDKHAQAIAELNDKLKKSNARIKTLVAKAKTFETEAEDIDKLIFPTLGFEWNQETASRTEAYKDARNSINDLFEACRGIAKSLNLKRAGTTVIDRMTKLMRMVPDLIKDWQASSARGVASLTLATCKARFPTMDFADIARGFPKGANIKLGLAKTQGLLKYEQIVELVNSGIGGFV
ncbi:hypothetical protein QYE76_058780 [Lolium multiflorum]|uniref:Transposase (putative) gypsy type domain-containing protein n=1 Tax=Lolium multiflorum TaxID=4521 RepID=A0AAD8T627_LOLMU|nr:hypothetical protein QYE76_058780 [Lolium multiflorum]